MFKNIFIFAVILSGAIVMAEERDASYGKWETYSKEYVLKYRPVGKHKTRYKYTTFQTKPYF